jgi:hypothetical protein
MTSGASQFMTFHVKHCSPDGFGRSCPGLLFSQPENLWVRPRNLSQIINDPSCAPYRHTALIDFLLPLGTLEHEEPGSRMTQGVRPDRDAIQWCNCPH